MMRNRHILVLLYLLCTFHIYAESRHNDDFFEAEPIDISISPNTDKISSLPGKIVGCHIIELRKSNNNNAIAKLFVDFFYHKRTKRDILDLLYTINIPLLQDEVEAICDYLISKGIKDRYYSGANYGYTIEAHSTPGTRISLILLNKEEIEIYKRWAINQYTTHSKQEEYLSGNLEGRLCVWPKRRKIHIGGPRVDYERAKTILLERNFD